MLHDQYSDCKSLTDHLLSPIPKQVEGKRLSIELAGSRQTLWVDDIPSHETFAPHGDVLGWIATHLHLADCFTQKIKPDFLNEAISSNEFIVTDRASEPPATTESRPSTTDRVDRLATFVPTVRPRHSSGGQGATSSEAAA